MSGRAGWIGLALLGVALSACGAAAGTPTEEESARQTDPLPLPDLGPAPELTSEVWLNSDGALRLSNLRGKVVLLDFWTFGCINCRRVIPSLRAWHETYASQGLVVIGNHFPEFGYEADLDNLRQAIIELEVPYPVAQDNDGLTWRAYRTQYWPTLVLIDKAGRIRFRHIGEGAYAETETAIQTLLAEAG